MLKIFKASKMKKVIRPAEDSRLTNLKKRFLSLDITYQTSRMIINMIKSSNVNLEPCDSSITFLISVSSKTITLVEI